jgi:hypothetical protein
MLIEAGRSRGGMQYQAAGFEMPNGHLTTGKARTGGMDKTLDRVKSPC